MLKKIRSVFSISKHNNKSKVIDLIRIIVIFQLLIVFTKSFILNFLATLLEL